MITPNHNYGAVLVEPIQRDRLIGMLKDALNQLYPQELRIQSKGDRGQNNSRTRSLRKGQVRYNACRSSIAKFGEFLSEINLSDVSIDEKLILDFELNLAKSGTPASYLRNHRNQIRKVINALPSDIRQRNIETIADYNRAHRWDTFSKETPVILDAFLKNGRKRKPRSNREIPELTSVLLSQPYREQIVREALTFLRVIEAPDILQVTADDVEEFIEIYESNDKRQAALGLLDYIHPLFTNLLAKGRIQSDPLADIPRKEHRENLDYVPQEGIDILADLSTLNMNSFLDVRNRLLCFILYYDFALRNREGALLKVSAINLEVNVSLILPKQIQKIQREDSLLFSNFPETTRPLLETYLKLRARKNPSTDILIITDNGLPLKADGCRLAVKDHCDRLGIKTFAGHTPTPHRLRHSLGTLNIIPLGKCLSLSELKDHYRHSSIETTERLYIAKNNILKTKRYEARMKLNGNGNGNGNGDGYSYGGLGLAPAITIQAANPQMPSPVNSLPPDKLISENEARRKVGGLGLDYRTLREYGIKMGQVQKDGRNYHYSSQFISDLTGNYFTSQEAMALLKMAKSTFFVWKNSEGIECIQIGQVGLYHKEVIMARKRAG